MSRLLSDSLAVGLTPSAIGLIHQPGGWRQPVTESSHPLDPADGVAVWSAGVRALDDWLAANKARRVNVRMTASDTFFRFSCVPWAGNGLGLGRGVQAALTQACFEERYGTMEGWTVCVEPGEFGKGRVACAIDTAFAESLKELLSRRQARCRFLAPALVATWNRWRRHVTPGDGLYVVHGCGRASLATRDASGWRDVRSLAVADACALRSVLGRERILQGLPDAAPAWLLAPELVDGPLADNAVRLAPEVNDMALCLAAVAWKGRA